MDEILKICILAAAQGIAEFLPISSSGHLLVLSNWFKFDVEESMLLNIVLHAGTLLAIIVFYFKSLCRIVFDPLRRRLIGLVIVGSIPAGVVGIALKKLHLADKLFASPYVAALGFAFTGTMLVCVFRKKEDAPDAVPAEKMSFKQAVLIGLAQALAITPGISRSGSTISCGVMVKLRKADAAVFSFLLAIPAIGGAALLEVVDMFKNSDTISGGELLPVFIGFIVSAVVGYFSLAGLIKLLKKGRLDCFAYYLFAAALITAAVETIKHF
ncbi:MAG: undecaprenyl-diphosphate phosphatase [Lentisphaeria bacterium]|nr:undecaprenyl-diphosphate phosphatase [Lentisphaeria bacterium]